MEEPTILDRNELGRDDHLSSASVKNVDPEEFDDIAWPVNRPPKWRQKFLQDDVQLIPNYRRLRLIYSDRGYPCGLWSLVNGYTGSYPSSFAASFTAKKRLEFVGYIKVNIDKVWKFGAK